MATEILRPQDCLRPHHTFYEPFTPKPFTNRRRSRPVRTTPSPNPKQARPNPKVNRKSISPRSTSPPSTPLSTSPLKDGFRLLKRGEAFKSGQNGSDKVSPVKSKETPLPQKKTQSDRSRHGSEPAKVGLYKDLTFAGPVYACRAPEASCLPQPGLSLLLRSSSVGPTNDDEASRALRSLLKL